MPEAGTESIVQPLVNTIKSKQKQTKKNGAKENETPPQNGTPHQEKPTAETQPEVKVIGPRERQICRCKICGQFLFEIATSFAVVRARCRRTECKLVNIVTIDGDLTTYRTEEKESSIRY